MGFQSSSYDEVMANHAICLLTWAAEHPDEWQSYSILEEETGVPKSTLWAMLHWDHDMAPHAGSPLHVWAWNLGYRVVVYNTEGLLLYVCKIDHF